ncbi:MAG: hypothetical protein H6664_11225 [Ardenticatenaceae bacterium]|nr:hypothetical protein [Ardenticatenaceae bacterium]
MNGIRLFVETGKKKTIVGAVDWPGWCRVGRDEGTAVQTLLDYAPRYAQTLAHTGIPFPTLDLAQLHVIERHDGNATTDFGAPAIILDTDTTPIAPNELARLQAILTACWQNFDQAEQQAAGKELRKGPRGGGRDLDKIVAHVLESERDYLRRLAWKYKKERGISQNEELQQVRQAVLAALQAAANGELPEQGPRGGAIWPPRYFIRRAAWHTLDHVWEIEDRVAA